jgi:hypothetical protein
MLTLSSFMLTSSFSANTGEDKRDVGEPESAECSEGVGVATGLLYTGSDGRRKGRVWAR